MTLHVPGFFIRLLLTLCGRSDLWSRFAGSLFVDTSKFEVLGWNPLKKTSGSLPAMLHADDAESVATMRHVL